MTHLAISNDWLPVDRWIAEALDNSVSDSQIEDDLVDCLLFWSAKHSIKGASSRDSLAKSLEAVRILVSIGIECHLTSLRSDSGYPSRLRDFFKAPFTRLKTLESRIKIETVLGLDSCSGDLAAYWKSVSEKRIDNRLYAMARKNYEDEVASQIQVKELLSIFNKIIKITVIPCRMVETSDVDTEEIQRHIRTAFAIHLNRIKRSTRLRSVTEYLADSSFKGFEDLTMAELNKIQGNAFLTGRRKEKVNREFIELTQQLDISEDVIQGICNGYTGLWTDYISRLWNNSENIANQEKGAEETVRSPLEWFSDNFVFDHTYKAYETSKPDEDDEMMKDLSSIFPEYGVEYSRKDLDSARGNMAKKELDIDLKKAEKRGLVTSRKEAGKKLYVLPPPNPHEY